MSKSTTDQQSVSSRKTIHEQTSALNIMEAADEIGTGAFSVRSHFEGLFYEQLDESGYSTIFLFYEKSVWRRRWDSFLTLLAHVNVIVIPFLVTFAGNSALGIENRPRMTSIQYSHRLFMQDVLFVLVIISILVYTIDVFIRGNTATKISFNEFEVRRKQLWISYITSFSGICDLVSVIGPIISLMPIRPNSKYGTDDYSKDMWQRGFIFLLFKSRLLFHINFPAKFGVFANRILRLFRMFILMLMVIHLLTCIWKLSVDVEKADYPEALSWDEVTTLYDGGIFIQDADVWLQYQAFSYYVLLLMFGENINPQTPLEKCCAFFIVMVGLVATALVVANMTYYVKVILQDSEAYHESMDNAEVLMVKLSLPSKLQELVREYMKYGHRKQSMIAPERYAQFLGGLSDSLRIQVMVETSRKFIAKCWLLGAFHQVPKAAAR